MSSVTDLMLQLHDAEAQATALRSTITVKTEHRTHLQTVKDKIQSETNDVLFDKQTAYQAMIRELAAKHDAEKQAIWDQMAADTALTNQELQELNDWLWDSKAELRKLNDLIDSLQRQIEMAQRAEAQATAWATLETRWNQMTMGLPWREWAKDHQITGAQKITYEGRLILGDTMGLGKTLTSLIAIDMIEAATREASPDNPITFGS